jgi:hypothetical protein
MKTLTEFAAATLLNALKTKKELTASGKTPEELPAAMGESLKLEGDKLAFLLHAADLIESKTVDLKRVIVFTLAEGEKAPNGAQAKEEKYYAAEYYPPLVKPGANRGGERDSSRSDRGGRGDRKGRDGKGRSGKGGPGGPGRPSGNDKRNAGGGSGENRNRPEGGNPPGRPGNRPPRAAPPRIATGYTDPSKITGKIIPVSQKAAEGAPAPEAPKETT